MKLLLTSAGFTTKEIRDSLAELVEKKLQDISVAIINEGYVVEEGDKRWNIEELSSIAKTVGGRIELVNLLALDKYAIEKKIINTDAVFVIGGHTDYLMSVFNKSGFSMLLQESLKDKVYIGSSAGSMVLGKRVSTIFYQEVFGEGEEYGISSYLERYDFAIKPHLDSPQFHGRDKEAMIKASRGYTGKIYAIRDDQAVVVTDPDVSFIGGDPIVFSDGKVLSSKFT